MITLPVLLLALAASALANDYISQHKQSMAEHYKHLETLVEFSCIHPQPRAIPVHDLLSTYQTRGLAFFPEYTVLYRCDVSTGCCTNGVKCGPKHAHVVKLPFKVTYLENMGDKQEGNWEIEYYRFENHTVCGCLDNQGNHDQGLPSLNLYPRISQGYASADYSATRGTGSSSGSGYSNQRTTTTDSNGRIPNSQSQG